MISIDDFRKLDVRIGTIISAEAVPNADKLLKLSVDLNEGKPRQIIAGIRAYVDEPVGLVGKQIPVLTNLEPRVIRGLESEGMILAACSEDSFALLHPSTQIKNGAIIR